MGTNDRKCNDLPDGLNLRFNDMVLNIHPISFLFRFSSVQYSLSSCPILCDPINCSTPGFPVNQQLPELTQTHVHQVGDAIQPSHPLSFPFPPALSLSQHQGLFKWVSSLHQEAKALEFQLHQSIQWTQYNFNLSKFNKIWFGTQDVIYPGECSMCIWGKKGVFCCFWIEKLYR